MKIQLFLLLLLSTVSLHADTSYWDKEIVRSYVHYSELQRRWAISFLAPHLKNLRGDEKILDIGCGDGKITADISKFVPNGTVLGVDLSSSMIGWAQRQYPKSEYPNVTFQKGEFFDSDLGSFDLIVSFCALQHCSDTKRAVSTIREALKPNGKVLLVVPLMNNEASDQAFSNVQNRPQWSKYWKNFSPRKFFSPEQYAELLMQSDLKAVSIVPVQTMDAFVDKEEFLDWLEGTYPPVIPKDQIREFYTQYLDEYFRLDPTAISSEGVIYAKFGYIGIEATLQD